MSFQQAALGAPLDDVTIETDSDSGQLARFKRSVQDYEYPLSRSNGHHE